uniref:Uncharacterized protein n=1 Tax=Candidatus Methanogaster sp. ANME-2c ERB4 TaxID=2759911 RepID=A0A7G9Y1I4_9EURY|nr:hypothetical protein BHILFNMA_00006 [Methanosarcinales archaeon ANME-2c ERB4]
MHPQKLPDCHVCEKMHVLRQLSDTLSSWVSSHLRIRRGVVYQNPSAGWRVVLCELLDVCDERALSGAGGSNDADDLAILDADLAYRLCHPIFVNATYYREFCYNHCTRPPFNSSSHSCPHSH